MTTTTTTTMITTKTKNTTNWISTIDRGKFSESSGRCADCRCSRHRRPIGCGPAQAVPRDLRLSIIPNFIKRFVNLMIYDSASSSFYFISKDWIPPDCIEAVFSYRSFGEDTFVDLTWDRSQRKTAKQSWLDSIPPVSTEESRERRFRKVTKLVSVPWEREDPDRALRVYTRGGLVGPPHMAEFIDTT
uniref:Uncharacterized protein n=1 Tax=Vespula pensylvanica TaxID=30213 RepID=A0A834PBB6_VESPE|nr:hypothetical protein H0235_003113 [Vespula pensylvanica]